MNKKNKPKKGNWGNPYNRSCGLMAAPSFGMMMEKFMKWTKTETSFLIIW